MSHTKLGPDRFSRFDVHWKKNLTPRQTDRQTNRQAKQIYKFNILHNVSMLVQGGGKLGFLLQQPVCCIMDAGSRTKEESRFEKCLRKWTQPF